MMIPENPERDERERERERGKKAKERKENETMTVGPLCKMREERKERRDELRSWNDMGVGGSKPRCQVPSESQGAVQGGIAW